VRFALIDEEKAHYPVARLCGLLGVSRAGYYAWCTRPESRHSQQDRRLEVQVRAAHEAGRRYYGSPRVHAELQAQGICVGRRRVIRLMREQRLRAQLRRRFKCTTKSDPALPVAPNLLDRDFTAERPNQRWVKDTTELLVPGGQLYLAVILDLFSRFVVGWALSIANDHHLTLAALDMAIRRRCPQAGLLCHSDRGSPYTCEDYQQALRAQGITCSMSRSGNCLDNAAMEAFNSSLKGELGEKFESELDSRQKVFDYIEVFYNQKRRHSSLGQLSPAEFERQARAGAPRGGSGMKPRPPRDDRSQGRAVGGAGLERRTSVSQGVLALARRTGSRLPEVLALDLGALAPDRVAVGAVAGAVSTRLAVVSAAPSVLLPDRVVLGNTQREAKLSSERAVRVLSLTHEALVAQDTFSGNRLVQQPGALAELRAPGIHRPSTGLHRFSVSPRAPLIHSPFHRRCRTQADRHRPENYDYYD
jgi:putative transposase